MFYRYLFRLKVYSTFCFIRCVDISILRRFDVLSHGPEYLYYFSYYEQL